MSMQNELATLAAEQIQSGHMDPERLKRMEALILEDGGIDDDEVQVLRDMILRTRKNTSHEVLRAEIEFLFRINEAANLQRNDETWRAFFIEAVSGHVFQSDDQGNMIIDGPEAMWLIDMVEADGKYDANEIALLTHLHDQGKEIPIDLRFRLGMVLSVD